MTPTIEKPEINVGRPRRFEPRHLIFSCLDAVARKVDTELSAWLAGLTFFYFVTTVLRAAKPFWTDEIVTFYLARMDSVTEAWRATTSGVDLQPPLMMTLAHFSQKLLGPNEVATRLPSILGVFVACGCIFAFIKRRSGAVFGLIGAVLILLSGAYHYATEARPYGLVLAGAAIALVSWQRATEPGRPPASLAGIAIGLWIALASHCFSVLLAIPFATGEIVRSWQHKRIDFPVWCAFALSASALVFYPPLFSSAGHGLAGKEPIFEPTLRSLWTVSSHMIGGAGKAIALAMVAVLWLRDRRQLLGYFELRVPIWEQVAVVSLAAIPVILTVLVAGIHSPIFYRYALAAILGMTILVTQSFERGAFGDRRMGALILLLFTSIFVERFVSDAFGRPDLQPQVNLAAKNAQPEIKVPGFPLLSMVTGDLPLVISSPYWFPVVAHYAPSSLAARTYYLRDPDAARRIVGSDFHEFAIPAMYRMPLPGHVADYSAFTATHRRFLVYTSSYLYDWLMGRLGPDGATFRFIGRREDAVLLEANLGER